MKVEKNKKRRVIPLECPPPFCTPLELVYVCSEPYILMFLLKPCAMFESVYCAQQCIRVAPGACSRQATSRLVTFLARDSQLHYRKQAALGFTQFLHWQNTMES